jgi:cysteine desulfuration protein SufE
MQSVLDDFSFVERQDRMAMLLDYAKRFPEVEVPERIATRPFDREHYVPRCESDAYVWAEDQPDGTLKFWFAVENPQGVSAKSWAVIMDEALSGQPLEEVVATSPEVIFDIYGRGIAMGKGQGLMGMLDYVTNEAKKRLAARRG